MSDFNKSDKGLGSSIKNIINALNPRAGGPDKSIGPLLSPDVFWRSICSARQAVLLVTARPLKVVRASNEALSLLGLEDSTDLTHDLTSMLDEHTLKHLDQALAHQVVLERHLVRLTIGGDSKPVRLTVSGLPEYPEKHTGLLFLTAEPMPQSTAAYKAVWELTTKLPYSVWVLDSKDQVVYANEAFNQFPLHRETQTLSSLDQEAYKKALEVLAKLPDQTRLNKKMLDTPLDLGSQGVWRILTFLLHPGESDARVWLMAINPEAAKHWRAPECPKPDELSPATLMKVLQIREDERMSIGREIHDYLGSEITVLRMELHRLKKVLSTTFTPSEQIGLYFNSVCNQIDKLAVAARRIAYDLRQEFVKSYGFSQSVKDLVLDMRYRISLSIQLEVSPNWVDPDERIAKHMHRSLQELLNNVSKHAKATSCLVRLGIDDGFYWLEVQDNGVGLSTNLPKNSVGFNSLAERSALFGGKVILQSRPEIEGTRVRVTMKAR